MAQNSRGFQRLKMHARIGDRSKIDSWLNMYNAKGRMTPGNAKYSAQAEQEKGSRTSDVEGRLMRMRMLKRKGKAGRHRVLEQQKWSDEVIGSPWRAQVLCQAEQLQ